MLWATTKTSELALGAGGTTPGAAGSAVIGGEAAGSAAALQREGTIGSISRASPGTAASSSVQIGAEEPAHGVDEGTLDHAPPFEGHHHDFHPSRTISVPFQIYFLLVTLVCWRLVLYLAHHLEEIVRDRKGRARLEYTASRENSSRESSPKSGGTTPTAGQHRSKESAGRGGGRVDDRGRVDDPSPEGEELLGTVDENFAAGRRGGSKGGTTADGGGGHHRSTGENRSLIRWYGGGSAGVASDTEETPIGRSLDQQHRGIDDIESGLSPRAGHKAGVMAPLGLPNISATDGSPNTSVTGAARNKPPLSPKTRNELRKLKNQNALTNYAPERTSAALGFSDFARSLWRFAHQLNQNFWVFVVVFALAEVQGVLNSQFLLVALQKGLRHTTFFFGPAAAVVVFFSLIGGGAGSCRLILTWVAAKKGVYAIVRFLLWLKLCVFCGWGLWLWCNSSSSSGGVGGNFLPRSAGEHVLAGVGRNWKAYGAAPAGASAGESVSGGADVGADQMSGFSVLLMLLGVFVHEVCVLLILGYSNVLVNSLIDEHLWLASDEDLPPTGYFFAVAAAVVKPFNSIGSILGAYWLVSLDGGREGGGGGGTGGISVPAPGTVWSSTTGIPIVLDGGATPLPGGREAHEKQQETSFGQGLLDHRSSDDTGWSTTCIVTVQFGVAIVQIIIWRYYNLHGDRLADVQEKLKIRNLLRV